MGILGGKSQRSPGLDYWGHLFQTRGVALRGTNVIGWYGTIDRPFIELRGILILTGKLSYANDEGKPPASSRYWLLRVRVHKPTPEPTPNQTTQEEDVPKASNATHLCLPEQELGAPCRWNPHHCCSRFLVRLSQLQDKRERKAIIIFHSPPRTSPIWVKKAKQLESSRRIENGQKKKEFPLSRFLKLTPFSE